MQVKSTILQELSVFIAYSFFWRYLWNWYPDKSLAQHLSQLIEIIVAPFSDPGALLIPATHFIGHVATTILRIPDEKLLVNLVNS